MARYGMVFDIRRCIGCNACVVACKQENSLPDGVFFTRTLSEDYGVYPNAGRVYIPTLCNHCEDAPCEKVCPSGATYTREDGIVMVNDALCIGCNSCAVACPYQARVFNWESSKAKIPPYPNGVLLKWNDGRAACPKNAPSAITALTAASPRD